MFIVWSKFFQTNNKGTAHEYRREENSSHRNGPFETRSSAEGFARGLATQPDIAQVQIEEIEDSEDSE